MNIGAIIFYIYFFIGFVVMNYDWFKYQKPVYDQAKKMGMVEDGMAIIYMMGVMIFWPIKIMRYIMR